MDETSNASRKLCHHLMFHPLQCNAASNGGTVFYLQMTGGAIWWPNMQLMQVAPSDGQMLLLARFFWDQSWLEETPPTGFLEFFHNICFKYFCLFGLRESWGSNILELLGQWRNNLSKLTTFDPTFHLTHSAWVEFWGWLDFWNEVHSNIVWEGSSSEVRKVSEADALLSHNSATTNAVDLPQTYQPLLPSSPRRVGRRTRKF